LIVIRLSAMGDVAMTAPLLRAFAHQYPEVKLTVCSKPGWEPLFQEVPNIHFFPVDTKGKHRGFIGILRWFWDIKKMHPTHVADLHEVVRSKIFRTLASITGIPTAYTSKARKEKKQLTLLQHKTLHPLTPIIKRHQQTFQKLGFAVNWKHAIAPARLLPEKVKATLQNHPKPWIGIAPFAQYTTKVYPVILMQEALEQLSTKTQGTIFLFGGGAKETAQLQQMATAPNIQVVAGKFTLTEELGLISNLQVMLSMDSANGHLAAIYGVPVVTLWGATHPYLGFTPFQQPLENSLLPNLEQYPFLPTSVYGKKQVPGYENAMHTIVPDMVVAKILSLLAFKSV
jgi:ADP-heptose:LPS heptosyltransferase